MQKRRARIQNINNLINLNIAKREYNNKKTEHFLTSIFNYKSFASWIRFEPWIEGSYVSILISRACDTTKPCTGQGLPFSCSAEYCLNIPLFFNRDYMQQMAQRLALIQLMRRRGEFECA